MPRGADLEPADAARDRDRSEGGLTTTSAQGTTWVGLVTNPHSGRGGGVASADRLVRELARRGFETRLAATPEERRDLVAEASAGPGCRCLVAVGGDGTVSALLNERPTVPIAVLPCGTENLFARHFGFSRKPERLAEVVERGQPRLVDLGQADGRRFGLMAGFGFDAEIVRRHHGARIGRRREAATTSRAAYVEPILRSSLDYEFPPLTIEAETDRGTERLVGTSVLCFNLPRYALGLPFAPEACDDDGWLDLIVFEKPGPLHALRYLWLVFRRLHLRRRGVEHRRIRVARVESTSVVPVQLDGDPGGRIEPGAGGAWSVEVVPSALQVLTTRGGSGN